jgi:hypothetical protein
MEPRGAFCAGIGGPAEPFRQPERQTNNGETREAGVMNYSNPNSASALGLASPQRSSFDLRYFSSRKCRAAFAPRLTRFGRERFAASYFELLMSLPAQKTLPQLMQVSSS